MLPLFIIQYCVMKPQRKFKKHITEQYNYHCYTVKWVFNPASRL